MSLELQVLNIKHHSKEWHAHRLTGIGASDASAVLGMNPYKSNVELWEEKMGLRQPKEVDPRAVEYGNKAEKSLVELFKLDYPRFKTSINKKVVYHRGFMFASLDGELQEREGDKRKGVLEIKTSAIFASMHKESWKDQVPQNYYIQILHQLIVTGWDFAYLKAHLRSTDKHGEEYIVTRHYPFERKDRLDDMRYLYEKEKEFWGYVERKECPPRILPTI